MKEISILNRGLGLLINFEWVEDVKLKTEYKEKKSTDYPSKPYPVKGHVFAGLAGEDWHELTRISFKNYFLVLIRANPWNLWIKDS